MASHHEPQAKQPLAGERRVTLTNWTRLHNSPQLLPRAAAVQWNEYVFLLAQDGTALLYHTKYAMWSMLPKCPYGISTPSVVNYNGEVLAVANNSIMIFDLPSSKWAFKKELATFDYQIHHLLVNNGKLYAGAEGKTRNQYGRTNRVEYSKPPKILISWTDNGWAEVSQLQLSVSGLLGTTTHFIILPSTTDKIKCLPIDTEAEDSSEREIPSPPHTGSTLHIVNDTLFSFGGRDRDNQPTSDVLHYNRSSDSWESAGYMRSSRYNTTVVPVQGAGKQELLVIGGSFGSSSTYVGANTLAPQEKVDWNCSACITEKCSVEYTKKQ